MGLFQLGPNITFETSTLVPQQVSFKKSWRWALQERIFRGPARQKIGTGDKTIAFTGVIFPSLEIGGKRVGGKQLKKIEDEGEKMQPMMLTDGAGNVYGRFCMLDLEEEKETFVKTGSARKQTFTITLGEYFEDEFAGPGGSSTITGLPL